MHHDPPKITSLLLAALALAGCADEMDEPDDPEPELRLWAGCRPENRI